MKNTMKKWLDFESDGSSGKKEGEEKKSFVLTYKNDPIGYLEYEKRQWTFEYSDWFKFQDTIVPLLPFPDKNKKYKSKSLWSFFSSRIPSEVNRNPEKLKKYPPVQSKADLLEIFGRKTITNPFILEGGYGED